MQTFFSALAMAVVWISAPAPSAFAQGRIEDLTVPAPALAGNLVGTAEIQQGAIYLPPSYRRASGRRRFCGTLP